MDDNSYHLSFSTGDTPQYTIDYLLDIISSASHVFAHLLSELSDILIDYLKELGIKFDSATGQIHFTLFDHPDS